MSVHRSFLKYPGTDDQNPAIWYFDFLINPLIYKNIPENHGFMEILFHTLIILSEHNLAS